MYPLKVRGLSTSDNGYRIMNFNLGALIPERGAEDLEGISSQTVRRSSDDKKRGEREDPSRTLRSSPPYI
jgi:hypothetical protein